MTPIVANTLRLLAEDGRPVTREEIRKDIRRLFRSNFQKWVGLPLDSE
jgi:hypothetical protein